MECPFSNLFNQWMKTTGITAYHESHIKYKEM